MLLISVKLKTDFVVSVHLKIEKGGECAVRTAGVWINDGVVWFQMLVGWGGTTITKE